MGAKISDLQAAVQALDTLGKSSAGWEPIVSRFVSLAPVWEGGVPHGVRVKYKCKNARILDILVRLLMEQLSGVDFSKGVYALAPRDVSMVLGALVRLLTVKAVYRSARKANPTPLLIVLRASCRRRDAGTATDALVALRLLLERVGAADGAAAGAQDRIEGEVKAALLKGAVPAQLLETLEYVHAATAPSMADELMRLFCALLGPHAATTPVAFAGELARALRAPERLPLLWEWSRSTDERLRVGTCELIIALALGATPEGVAAIQASGREWGALLWHLRLSVAAAPGDADMDRTEAQLRKAHIHQAASHATLENPIRGAALGSAAARDASRRLVQCLCWHAPESVETVSRVLPPALAAILTKPPVPPAPPAAPVLTADAAPVAAAAAPSGGGGAKAEVPGSDGPATSDAPPAGAPGGAEAGSSKPEEPAEESDDEAGAAQTHHSRGSRGGPYIGVDPAGRHTWDHGCAPRPHNRQERAEAEATVRHVWFGYDVVTGQAGGGGSAPACNWGGLWEALLTPAAAPTLVWRAASLTELRLALGAEAESLDRRRAAAARARVAAEVNKPIRHPDINGYLDSVSAAALRAEVSVGPLVDTVAPSVPWDWRSFEVRYPSLDEILCVAGYYLYLLIPKLEDGSVRVEAPRVVIDALARHLVTEDEPGRALAALQCLRHLTRAAGTSAADIAELPAVDYIVWLIRHTNCGLRDVAVAEARPGVDAAFSVTLRPPAGEAPGAGDEGVSNRSAAGGGRVEGVAARWQALWRAECVMMLEALCRVPSNVKAFVRAGGIPALLPLLIVPPTAPAAPEDSVLEATDADGGGAGSDATAPAGASESDFMGDVNLRFSVSQTAMPPARLARAAADVLLAAVRAWPGIARAFADAEYATVLTLALLQPRHPSLVKAVMTLALELWPRAPLFAGSLHDAGFFQAVLLTADSKFGPMRGRRATAVVIRDAAAGFVSAAAVSAGSSSEAPAPAPLSAPGSGLEGHAIGPFEGLCPEAAALLAALHSSRVDAEVREGLRAPPDPEAGSSLAPLLPSAIVRLLRGGGDAFARVFNAEAYSSTEALWSAAMARRLMQSLRRQMRDMIAWVACEPDARARYGGLTVHCLDAALEAPPGPEMPASRAPVEPARAPPPAPVAAPGLSAATTAALAAAGARAGGAKAAPVADTLGPNLRELARQGALRKAAAGAAGATSGGGGGQPPPSSTGREPVVGAAGAGLGGAGLGAGGAGGGRRISRQLAAEVTAAAAAASDAAVCAPNDADAQAAKRPRGSSGRGSALWLKLQAHVVKAKAAPSLGALVRRMRAVAASGAGGGAGYSGAGLLAGPTAGDMPPIVRVRYPELDAQPTVAGVFLAHYVGSSSKEAPLRLSEFIPALVEGLRAEASALAAAHLALLRPRRGDEGAPGNDATANDAAAAVSAPAVAAPAAAGRGGGRFGGAVDRRRSIARPAHAARAAAPAAEPAADTEEEAARSDPAHVYARAHTRCHVMLCAMRKLLADLPGAKLPVEAYTVLARLLDVMRGYYPMSTDRGAAAAGGGGGGAADGAVTLDDLSMTFHCEGLPALAPPSLLLLLPPNAAHDASLDRSNRASASGELDGPREPALHPFEGASTRAQAVAVRAGAEAGAACVSSAALALAVLRGAVCPNTQTTASRKAAVAAVDGGVLAAALELVGWALPQVGAAANIGEEEDGEEADAGAVASGARTPSAVSASAMSPAERSRLWLTEPLVVEALGVVALVAATEAGLGLFVRRPVLLLTLLRAARVVWADGDAPCFDSANPSEAWTVLAGDAAAAAMRCAAPALTALATLAVAAQLRRAFLDTGALVMLSLTALGPDDETVNDVDPSGTRDRSLPPSMATPRERASAVLLALVSPPMSAAAAMEALGRSGSLVEGGGLSRDLFAASMDGELACVRVSVWACCGVCLTKVPDADACDAIDAVMRSLLTPGLLAAMRCGAC